MELTSPSLRSRGRGLRWRARAALRLVELLKGTKRLAEVAPFIRRAVGIFTKRLGSEHLNSHSMKENYATLLEAMGGTQHEI